MKLKSENGMVEFIMKTGKDFVKSKTSESAATIIIAMGKTEMTDTHKSFPLCVDDKYYFPVLPEESETPTKKPTTRPKRKR